MRALPCEHRAGREVDGPLMSYSIVLLLVPRVTVRCNVIQRTLSVQSQHCVTVEVNTCVGAPVKGALLELGGGWGHRCNAGRAHRSLVLHSTYVEPTITVGCAPL